jgi:hypothetical protein
MMRKRMMNVKHQRIRSGNSQHRYFIFNTEDNHQRLSSWMLSISQRVRNPMQLRMRGRVEKRRRSGGEVQTGEEGRTMKVIVCYFCRCDMRE